MAEDLDEAVKNYNEQMYLALDGEPTEGFELPQYLL